MDGKPLTVLAGAKLAGDAQVQLLGDPEPIDIEVEVGCPFPQLRGSFFC
jgi:hypothetical protein